MVRCILWSKGSWFDAMAFCKRLLGLPEEKKAGSEHRLPTEAQWEYACRPSSRQRSILGIIRSFLTRPLGLKRNNPIPFKRKSRIPESYGLHVLVTIIPGSADHNSPVNYGLMFPNVTYRNTKTKIDMPISINPSKIAQRPRIK